MYVNGGSVIAIGVIFPVLGSLAVICRFITKTRHQTGLRIDDWLCLPALAIVIATGVLLVYGAAAKSIGYHSPPGQDVMATLTSETPQFQLTVKILWIITTLYPIGTGLVRLSFLFFYRRLFRGRVFDIVSWVVIGIIIMYMISFTVSSFCVCDSNLPAAWTSLMTMKMKCFDTFLFVCVLGIVGFCLDFIVLSVPFFWIWRLQMPTHQKWAVTSVYLCGFFIIAASAMRVTAGALTVEYKFGQEIDMLGLKATDDTIGGISMLIFWQYIEHGTGMVVCCLPSLRPVLASRSFVTAFHGAFSQVSGRVRGRRRASYRSSADSSVKTDKVGYQISVTRSEDANTSPV